MTSSKRSRARFRFRDNAFLPTPRLLRLIVLGTAVTLLASAWGMEIQAAAGFYSILGILTLADAVGLWRKGKVELSRSTPHLFELGSDSDVVLRASHPAPYPVRVHLRDDFPLGFYADRRDLSLTLPPAGSGSVMYRLRPHRRGLHPFGKIHARVTGRLGLLMRQQAQTAEHEVRVFPPLQEVRRVRAGVYRKLLTAEGPHTWRGLGQGSEFSHIRGYVPGDEPRLINWSATARRHKLATNAYQPEQGQHVVILIDCGRIMGVKDGEWSRLDRAVEGALAFAAIALERGDQVSLFAFANRVLRWVPGAKGRSQLQRLVEACYNLEPAYAESNYRAVVESLAFRQNRRALVALFTDTGNLTYADDLVEQLTRLQRHHAVMTVTCEDPILQREQNRFPQEELDVFRKTVAQRVSEERREQMVYLRRRGVTVLDVPPDQLATSVIHQYIEIKNRGLL